MPLLLLSGNASCVVARCCRAAAADVRRAGSPGAVVLLLLLKPVLSLLVGADWLQPRLAAVRPSPLRACAGCSTPISVLAGRRVGWDADCGPVEPARISRVAGCCGSVGRDRGQRQQSTTSIAVRHRASSGMNSRPEPALHTRFSTNTCDRPHIARPGPRLSSPGPHPEGPLGPRWEFSFTHPETCLSKTDLRR